MLDGINERLTDDAREAIRLGQEESRALGHGHFADEHLLLGLLRHENAFAARALTVTLENVREQVEDLLEDSYEERHEARKTWAEERLREEWREPSAGIPRSKNILERALRQTEISGHYYIGTLHLLLGLLEEPEGVAVRALSNLGVETPDVRRKVMKMLRSGEYREEEKGGLRNSHRGGRKGTMIRLEVLGDDELARELDELLVFTGIVEIPDETSSPPGLPSGERNEPLEIDAELALRIERAVERLGSHIEVKRDDLLALEIAREKLIGLLSGRAD